jgi:succinoglycan biosynthesis transport protein ExoP
MEEEIDLREYIEVLIRRWHWIAGLTLVAVLAAGLVSFFVLEPYYKAEALVLITGPRYQLQFDPRVETVADVQQAYKAYPSLAMSDDLLRQVLEVINLPLPTEESTLGALKGKLKATAGADPSLLQLTVTDGNPEQAAHIANTWAEQYVTYADGLFSRRAEDAVFFSQQLEEARTELQAAEEALIEFQARNQSSILSARLSSARQAQNEYLADQRSIARILQDVGGLRSQLSDQPIGDPSSLGNDLTALFLQIKAFNAESTAPIQLQVSSAASLSGRTVDAQVAFLDDLGANLEAKSTVIDERLAELEPQILSLQQAVQEINTDYDRLTRDRDVAQQTYMALANKVQEARIAAQDETGEVQLASRASVPTRPAGPSKPTNIAVAGFVGLFLGVFAAYFIEFWRSPHVQSQRARNSHIAAEAGEDQIPESHRPAHRGA